MAFVMQNKIWEQFEVFVCLADSLVPENQGKGLLKIVKYYIILNFWTFL